MADNSMYITTHEAALALVATAMKKARLRFDTLVVNSLIGGMLFSVGGMFHVIIYSKVSSTSSEIPLYADLMIAACYPLGLFYVVIMGAELFNSNILFYSVGVMRGAVSVVDLIISWLVSWWLNLAANIFVCYVICYFSTIFATEEVISGSRELLDYKASFMFHQTLIKAMAGNFYVALAVYLQIMAKPLHVKFILIFLPIFSFVGLGFTHSVADMFVLTMGLVNGSSHSVGEIAWKVFLPGALGNMIGGTFFGIVIPWYSHIYSVEQDQRLLNLPQYELRDEQPEINSDSRVVRERRRVSSAIIDEKPKTHSTDISGSTSVEQFSPPQGLYDDTSIVSDSSHARSLSRVATGASLHSRHTSLRSRSHSFRSPKNVFPVYGMGEPLERERTIASGKYEDAPEPMTDDGDVESERSAEFVGTRIKRILSRPPHTDLEHQRSHTKSVSSRRTKPTLRQYSISSQRSYRSNSSAYRNRMYNAGIPPSAMVNSDFVAGVASGTPSPSYTPVLAPATRVRRASTEPGSMGISGSGSIPKRTDSNVSPNHSSEDITDLSRLASL